MLNKLSPDAELSSCMQVAQVCKAFVYVCHESSTCLHNCISWNEVKFAAAAPNNSSPASRPGEATGSWWSGSAKHPNWHRQSAAAESQRSQMLPSTCHVFKEGQEGESEALAKAFSSGANLTHVFGTPLDFRSLLTLRIFPKRGGFSHLISHIFQRILGQPNAELAPTAGHASC